MACVLYSRVTPKFPNDYSNQGKFNKPVLTWTLSVKLNTKQAIFVYNSFYHL